MLQDIRLSLRLFRRNFVPMGIAWVSIALSVGATAVVFAAVKAVLLDPLPFTRPAELVQFRSDFPRLQEQSHGDWVVWNDTRELARRTRAVGAIGVYGNAIFDLAGGAGTIPEALYGVRMNANLFSVLGVTPMLGRNILPEEERPGHPDVLILNYGLWVRRFHSDRSIVGHSITVNGHSATVAGVMPPGFNFPMRRSAAHTPSPYVEFWAGPMIPSANPNAGLGAVARLRPGVSMDAARQDVASIGRDLEHDFPGTNRDRELTAVPFRASALGSASRGLWLLTGAAVLFMLIGCANVANLLLARGLGRQREMAVRMAMGAGGWRLVRQLLTESCVLAVLGGLGGYLLTVVAWRLLPAVAPVTIPRLAAARAGAGVLGFALAVAVANGILFGLAPALRLAGSNLVPTRGVASGGRDFLRSSLVAAEVALSVLLVVVGSEVLSSFVRLIASDPGFRADGVLASVILPAPERYPKPERRGLFYQRILSAVRALPGVESAGTVDALPFSGENHGGFVSRNAASTQGEPPLTAEIDVVGGDYLQAMGIHLMEGRWFERDDTGSTDDGAIVSEVVAHRLWPGESAVGQRICVYCAPDNPPNWKRVIGVVSGASHSALNEIQLSNVYLAAGAMQSAVFLVARTARPPGEMATAIRRAVAAIDPNQPVFLTASMKDLVADSVADRRFILLLLAATGCLALMMSAAGVYGVTSYATSRRTQEIGIRMAVGATPLDVFSLIFRQGFVSVAIGLAIGLAAAVACTRTLAGTIAGLEGGHGSAVWLATAVFTLTAAAACWIPARRATRTDPICALRVE